MALSEWQVFKSDLMSKATIDTRSPIAGGGSLILSDNGATNPQIVLLRSVLAERGFLSAKMRSIFRIDNIDGAGVGFVFMLDQLDITGTSGNFYGLFVGQALTDGVNKLMLAKYLDGMKSAYTTLIYSENYNPVGVFALEVEWASDLGTLSGTRITIRRSSPSIDNVDFNNMITVYSTIDTTNPLLVSQGEGIAYHNVFDGTNKFTLDKSSMIKV